MPHGATDVAGANDNVSRPDELTRAEIGELYVEYRGLVAATIRNICGPTHDLDDLVQAAFTSALAAAKSFRGDSSPRTWLYRIAVNTALQELRRRRRWRWIRPFAEANDIQSVPSRQNDESRLSSRSALRQLDGVLSGLSPKKRAVFVLVEIEGLSTKEAGEVLEIPHNTVRSRLRVARNEVMAVMDTERVDS